jgi:hypothetical protein
MPTNVTARFVIGALVVALSVPLGATASQAAGVAMSGLPQASLYELTENMKLKGKKIAHRVAVSALAGSAVKGTPFCPSSAGTATCDLTAEGSDDINGTTGLGTFQAQVVIVVQGDNPFDGPEAVIDRVNVAGKMDFSPALVQGQFFGTVKGTSTPTTGKAKAGKVKGVFLLPFIGSATYPYIPGGTLSFRQVLCPATPNPNPHLPVDFAYVETAQGELTGRCIDIRPEELSLGWPTVRFDVWFD